MKTVFIVLLFIFCNGPLAAARPYTILFCGHIGNQASEVVVEGLEKEISRYLADERNYKFIDYRNLPEISYRKSDFKNVAKYKLLCDSISADKIVYFKFTQHENDNKITAYVYNPKHDIVEHKTGITYSPLELTDEASRRVCRNVTEYLKNNKPLPGIAPLRVYFSKVPIPGESQRLYNYKTKGLVIQGLFLTGVVATAGSCFSMIQAKDDYENYRPSPDYPDDTRYRDKLDVRYQRYRTSAYLFQGSLMFTGAVCVYHMVDVFLFSRRFNLRVPQRNSIAETDGTIMRPLIRAGYDSKPLYGLGIECSF